MDDTTIVGPPEKLKNVFEKISSEAKNIGLEVQPHKCQLIYFHEGIETISEDIINFCSTHHIPIQKNSAVILGAPIGRTDDDIIDALKIQMNLNKQSDDLTVGAHSEFFQSLLSQHLTVQESMILLRMSGVSKFNYFMRIIRPTVMSDLAGHLDKDIHWTMKKKLDINRNSAPRPQAWKNAKIQMRLPTRMGGLGLSSLKDISPIAYFSAVAATVEYTSRKNINLHSISSTAGQLNTQIKNELGRCLDYIRSSTEEKNILDYIPTSADTFQSYYQPYPNSNDGSIPKTKGLQSLLTTAMHHTHALQLKKSGPIERDEKTRHDARLNAVNAPGSSTWINTIPTENHLTLSNFQYSTAVRNRLGLKPLNIMPDSCADCGRAMDVHSDHYLACPNRMKNELNTRHNQVAHFIHRTVITAGGCAIIEPTHLDRESRKRPDLEIVLDGNRIFADVSIVHPTAPSHCEQAARRPLASAESMEKTKINKYSNMASNHDCTFIPIVLESYGGMPMKCFEFISTLSIFSEQNANLHGWRNIAKDLAAGMAIAVQRGNGMAARACLISVGMH
jgi:hypothetical protein